jgi:hypothetical protein
MTVGVTGVAMAGKSPPPTTVSPLAIYDASGALAARVLNGTQAIISSGNNHYVTSVFSSGANLRLGKPFKILYVSTNCSGQAYYPRDSVSGSDYLSQGLYIIDFRPDGSYLTPVATLNLVSGLSVMSEQVFDANGTMICDSGASAPGWPHTYSAIEIQQAGTAEKVTGPAPYSIR